ncbi:MAG: hybrid sensor histidine kinase/response regulator [Duodenibacillus sp.]|nr:hybrid sensor histidine kinase/response regulator [Duodenibacillus sp.]
MTVKRLWHWAKRLFGAGQGSQSPHLLAEQIRQSFGLMPVAIVSQLVGQTAIAFYFWDTMNRWLMVSWVAIGMVECWRRTLFHRRFLADASKEERIRGWLMRWLGLALFSGAVWGVSGFILVLLSEPVDQAALIAVIVAVVFASWPAYACWLPSLTAFTLVSLTPVVVAAAWAFDFSRTMTAGILLLATVLILFCGRRLNDFVVLSVTRESLNKRLVTRLRAEKMLAENERRATARASERRAKFFAGANHDLRQPLQAMGLYLQILKMQQPSGPAGEIVDQLAASAANISTLVEQILEVSRIETGNVAIKVENVPLRPLFAELEREFKPVAAAKGLVFRAKSVDAAVTTDPLLVSRILRNLISNAIRYTAATGGEVVLGARRLSRGRLSVGVYDSGPGIPKDELRRIFEPFFRGESGKAVAGGHGLGLSIVRNLAAHLSIPLSVSSRVGRGTVFRLEFGETAVMQAPEEEQPPQAFEPRTGLKLKGTVDLLEDNDFVRQALADMIRSWGAEVAHAASPETVYVERLLAMAAEGELAALVTDYNLGSGVPTGLEVYFVVQKGSGRRLPCVILSAVSADEIRKAFRALRMDSENAGTPMPVIIQKPTTPKALAAALARAMQAAG